MLSFSINWLALFLVVILHQVLGFFWYGPLFGKAWLKEVGKKMEDLRPGNNVTSLSILSSVVLGFMMANVVGWAGVSTTMGGAEVGLLVWLGFVGATSLLNVAFEGRSQKLWTINNAYYLLNCLIAGIVFVLWP